MVSSQKMNEVERLVLGKCNSGTHLSREEPLVLDIKTGKAHTYVQATNPYAQACISQTYSSALLLTN